MSFYVDTNIWHDLFESFLTWLKTDIYPLQEQVDIVKYVDVVDDINPNIPGNYFVKEDNIVYDETKTLVYEAVSGDKFYAPSIEQYYFINSKDKFLALSDKDNNSRIGDEGIFVSFGDVDLNSSDPIPINEIPSIKFTIETEEPTDALANTNVDTNRILNFSIRIIVDESNLHTNIGATGYNQTNIVKGLVEKWIKEYYISSQCQIIDGVGKRIFDWQRAFNMIVEKQDGIRLSEIINQLTYK